MAENSPEKLEVKTGINLAEALALAVLRGDLNAAYALSDLLQEQRANPTNLQEKAAGILAGHTRGVVDSFEVYRWPEFRAFADRLGFLWDLRTVDCSIHFRHGSVVTIEHVYQAINNPPAPSPNPTVNTTTRHTEGFITAQPESSQE